MNYCKVEGGKITSSPVNDRYLNDPENDPTQYPVEYPSGEYVFDIATQKRLEDTLEIVGDKVMVIFNIVNKTQEELEAYAIEAAKPQPPTTEARLTLMEIFLKAKFSEDGLFPEALK